MPDINDALDRQQKMFDVERAIEAAIEAGYTEDDIYEAVEHALNA